MASFAERLRHSVRARTAGAWLPIGEILVGSGEVSRSQVSDALKRGRATGRRVGEELVSAGDLRPERLAAALRLQRRLALLAFAAT